MKPQNGTISTVYLAVLALLGWFAVIAQFYIYINLKIVPLAETVIRFFSYFTIDTNILLAVCCTTLCVAPASSLGRFFSRQQTLAAITVYIFVVGLVYNIVLRFLWNPQGLQLLVDELLHSVIPVLFVFYWLTFVWKDRLIWKNVWPWLIYPLAYAILILIRGSFSQFYPYPFVDVNVLGLDKALINIGGLTVFFLILSLFSVAIGKFINGKRIKNQVLL